MAYYGRPWEDVTVDTSTAQGVANASDYGSPTWNQPTDATDVVTDWELLTKEQRASVTRVAEAIDYRGTGRKLWERAVAASARTVAQGDNYRTPWDIINAQGPGTDEDPSSSNGPSGSRPSGGSSGGGGYTGPQTSTSRQFADRASLTDLADQVAMEFLGRGVTKEEMDRIEKRVKIYEQNHPDVTVSQGGVGVSDSRGTQGASAAGRQDVIERIIAKNPEYGDYQKATTLMDMFNNALSERLQRG